MVAKRRFAPENRFVASARAGFYSGFQQYIVGVPGTLHARLGAQHNI
jgi:hypothetical protein